MKVNEKMVKWAAQKYLPSFLTGAGMSGVVVTGCLGVAAGMDSQKDITALKENNDGKEPTMGEIAKETWTNYVPTVAAGVLSMSAIFGAHVTHLKKETALAAVAALYSSKYRKLSELARNFGDGNIKAVELVEEEKRQRESANVDYLTEYDVKNGKHLYYEPFSHQYFKATANDVNYAQLYINKQFQEYGGVTLNDFLDVLPGCKPFDAGNQLGWYQGTDAWEEVWTDFGEEIGHFIDFDLVDDEANPEVRVIDYRVFPSLPDDDWMPWH